jgi:hypothetical protein
MSLRGRGLLEIKPSPNPFFQTTTGEIGAKPDDQIQWKVDGRQPPFQHGKHAVDGNFAFLYTRESDRIGAKVAKPVMKETRLLTKTEFLKKKREEFAATFSPEEEEVLQDAAKSPAKPTADDILAVYKHVPKYEDPRYTTSTVMKQTVSPPVCNLKSYSSYQTERLRQEASIGGYDSHGARCAPPGLLPLLQQHQADEHQSDHLDHTLQRALLAGPAVRVGALRGTERAALLMFMLCTYFVK